MSDKACTLEDCDRKFYARGWCEMHYKRWQKHGDPAYIKPLSDLFWSKVDKSGECWEWTSTKRGGYGRFSVAPRRQMSQGTYSAHRMAWEMIFGPIPSGREIDHRCHNRGCVNPEHLRLTTRKENIENHSGPTVNNTSGVRGVSWHKANRKWVAHVAHNLEKKYLGSFESLEEAASAVVQARIGLHTHNDADRIAS